MHLWIFACMSWVQTGLDGKFKSNTAIKNPWTKKHVKWPNYNNLIGNLQVCAQKFLVTQFLFLFCVSHREISAVRKQPVITSTCSRFPSRVCRSWRESGYKKWLWSDSRKALIWDARSPSLKVHRLSHIAHVKRRPDVTLVWLSLQLFSVLFLMFRVLYVQMARSGKSHSGGSWIRYQKKRETKVCVWFVDARVSKLACASTSKGVFQTHIHLGLDD